jgi:hypothetical protein
MKRWLFFAVACGLLLTAIAAAFTVYDNAYAAQRDKWGRYLDQKYFPLMTGDRRDRGFHEPYEPPSFGYYKADTWAAALGAVGLVGGLLCARAANRAAGPEPGGRRTFNRLLAMLAVAAAGAGCYLAYDRRQYDMRQIETRLVGTIGGGDLPPGFTGVVGPKNLDKWRGQVAALGPWVSASRRQAALDRIAELKKAYAAELKERGWTATDLRLLD